MGRWKISLQAHCRAAGTRGANEKETWNDPGEFSEKCIFFFFQPVLLQVTLFSPCPSTRVCGSRQVFILQLPLEGSLITVSSLSLSQENTIEKVRLGPDISEYFSFPELLAWLLLRICTSGWCKIPHSLCFIGTYSLVDFNL